MRVYVTDDSALGQYLAKAKTSKERTKLIHELYRLAAEDSEESRIKRTLAQLRQIGDSICKIEEKLAALSDQVLTAGAMRGAEPSKADPTTLPAAANDSPQLVTSAKPGAMSTGVASSDEDAFTDQIFKNLTASVPQAGSPR